MDWPAKRAQAEGGVGTRDAPRTVRRDNGSVIVNYIEVILWVIFSFFVAFMRIYLPSPSDAAGEPRRPVLALLAGGISGVVAGALVRPIEISALMAGRYSALSAVAVGAASALAVHIVAIAERPRRAAIGDDHADQRRFNR